MATKSFTRGQTKPSFSSSEFKRRGGDISRFTEESVQRAIAEGRLEVKEIPREEFPGFESEELQMSVAGKSDIERATGQTLTREAFLRDYGIIRGISSPNISTPYGPGRIETGEGGRQIFVPAGTPVTLRRTGEATIERTYAPGGLRDVSSPFGFGAEPSRAETRAERGERLFRGLEAREQRAEAAFGGGIIGGILASPVTVPSRAIRTGIVFGSDIDRKILGREYSQYLTERRTGAYLGSALDIGLIGLGQPIARGVGRGIKAVTPASFRNLAAKAGESFLRKADVAVERLKIPRLKYFTETKVSGLVGEPQIIQPKSLSKIFPGSGLIAEQRIYAPITGIAEAQTKFGLPKLKLGVKIGKPEKGFFTGDPFEGSGVVSERLSPDVSLTAERLILGRQTRKGIEKSIIETRSTIAKEEAGRQGRLFLRRYGIRGAEATRTASLGLTYRGGKPVSILASTGKNIKIAETQAAKIYASLSRDMSASITGRGTGKGISKQIVGQLKPIKTEDLSRVSMIKPSGKGLKGMALFKDIYRTGKISKTSEQLIRQQFKPQLPRFTETSLSKITPSIKLAGQKPARIRQAAIEKQISSLGFNLGLLPVSRKAARIGLLPKQKTRKGQAQIPRELQLQLPRLGLMETQTTSQLQKQLQLQLPKQLTAQLPRQTARFNFPSGFDFPFRVPVGIPLPIFGAIGEGYLTSGGRAKRRERYQASLVGLISGLKLTGKVPKQLTGLEIRYPRNLLGDSSKGFFGQPRKRRKRR